jgi:hypothetical protein
MSNAPGVRVWRALTEYSDGVVIFWDKDSGNGGRKALMQRAQDCGLNCVLNGVSNNIVSYTFRSVVPLASEGHVSPRSRYWSLGDEAVSVDG